VKKILFILLSALPLFAGFFPATSNTTVSSVNQETVTLASPFAVRGMSGIVMHNFDNGIKAATHSVISTSSATEATLTDADTIHHDNLPSIKTAIAVGDQVIGGYLYENVLVIAPNAETYSKIVSSYNKNWMHPDIYAQFLSRLGDNTPNKENLKQFAQEKQVGLIYIVQKEYSILFDPISGQIVAQKESDATSSELKYPFFMRLNNLKSGWFSGDAKGDYYKAVGSL